MRDQPKSYRRRTLVIGAAIWALLALLLNLPWEIAQLPLYEFSQSPSGTRLAYFVMHCTAGDAAIAVTNFLVTGFMLSNPNWPTARPWLGGVIVTFLGLTYTVFSEWHNVYQTGAWNYARTMPLISGIGLSPLLQWLIIPVIVLFTYRKISSRGK